MFVAITITYNAIDANILEGFLKSVQAQDHLNFQLIIIDNNSADETPAYLRQLDDPRIKCIFNTENIGFGAACNQGIAVAEKLGASHILLLNNDTEFESGIFAELEKSLQASDATAVTPIIMVHGGNDVWYGSGSFRKWRGFTSFHDNVSYNEIKHEAPFDVQFAPACFLLFNADFLYRHGGFDDNYFVYWEDVDYCLMMERLGGRIVVVPQIRIEHKVSSTTGLDSDFSIIHKAKGHVILLRRFYPSIVIPYVISILTSKAVIRWITGKTSFRKIALELKWLFRSIIASRSVERFKPNQSLDISDRPQSQ